MPPRKKTSQSGLTSKPAPNQEPRSQPRPATESKSVQRTKSGTQTQSSTPTHSMMTRSRQRQVPALLTFPRDAFEPPLSSMRIRHLLMWNTITHASATTLEARWYGLWDQILNDFFKVVLFWGKSNKATVMQVYPQYPVKVDTNANEELSATLESITTSRPGSLVPQKSQRPPPYRKPFSPMPPPTPSRDPIDALGQDSEDQALTDGGPVALSPTVTEMFLSYSSPPSATPRPGPAFLPPPTPSSDPIAFLGRGTDHDLPSREGTPTPTATRTFLLPSSMNRVIDWKNTSEHPSVGPQGGDLHSENAPHAYESIGLEPSAEINKSISGDTHARSTREDNPPSPLQPPLEIHSNNSQHRDATLASGALLDVVVEKWRKAEKYTTRIPDFVIVASEVSTDVRMSRLQDICSRQRIVLIIEVKPPGNETLTDYDPAHVHGFIMDATGQLTDQAMHAFSADPDLEIVGGMIMPGPWYFYTEFGRPKNATVASAGDSDYRPSQSPSDGSQEHGDESDSDQDDSSQAWKRLRGTDLGQKVKDLFEDNQDEPRNVAEDNLDDILEVVFRRVQECSGVLWPQTQNDAPNLGSQD